MRLHEQGVKRIYSASNVAAAHRARPAAASERSRAVHADPAAQAQRCLPPSRRIGNNQTGMVATRDTHGKASLSSRALQLLWTSAQPHLGRFFVLDPTRRPVGDGV